MPLIWQVFTVQNWYPNCLFDCLASKCLQLCALSWAHTHATCSCWTLCLLEQCSKISRGRHLGEGTKATVCTPYKQRANARTTIAPSNASLATATSLKHRYCSYRIDTSQAKTTCKKNSCPSDAVVPQVAPSAQVLELPVEPANKQRAHARTTTPTPLCPCSPHENVCLATVGTSADLAPPGRWFVAIIQVAHLMTHVDSVVIKRVARGLGQEVQGSGNLLDQHKAGQGAP